MAGIVALDVVLVRVSAPLGFVLATPCLLVVGGVALREVWIHWRGPALTVSLLPPTSTAQWVSRDFVSPWPLGRYCRGAVVICERECQ